MLACDAGAAPTIRNAACVKPVDIALINKANDRFLAAAAQLECHFAAVCCGACEFPRDQVTSDEDTAAHACRQRAHSQT